MDIHTSLELAWNNPLSKMGIWDLNTTSLTLMGWVHTTSQCKHTHLFLV